MYKNIKVEAEHNELILENSHGDKVIIPANKRNWVKQKLSEGCHNCIDSLVETLPVASQYAQDGSVYPTNKKVKVNQDNQIKEYDINSNEYKDLYNSGKLMSYDKNTDTYIATPLKEATITAEAPQWLKDKRNLEKQYSKDWYIDNNLPKFSRAMRVSSDNMGGNQKGYDEYINNKLAESILKRNPNFDKDYKNDRLKTLSNYSQKELEIIKSSNLSHKIEPSIWSKFEQGLLSVGNTGSPVTFKNENLTQEEAKKEDNPLNILQPLNIPSKMVQSAYKKDYSLKDALKGKQNNANIEEDIITDPLNLVGLGIWSKLSKANKFRNLDEAYQSIKGLSKEGGLSKLVNESRYEHNLKNNPNLTWRDDGDGLLKPYNTKSGKLLQEEYIDNLKSYYDSPEFKRIMKEHHPDVDIETYKQKTLQNLENPISSNPKEVGNNLGVYKTKASSDAVYLPGHTPTFKQKVNNANTNKFSSNDRGKSYLKVFDATDHELSHQRTNADELLPNFLTDEFLKKNVKPEINNELEIVKDLGENSVQFDNFKYQTRPTEFEVRLRQLKEDLKSNNINDYFKNPMTEEHINDLLKPELEQSKIEQELFTSFNKKYREAKNSGMNNQELQKLKDSYFEDLDKIKIKKNTISGDTQDLLKYYSPKFLAEIANKLPAIIPFYLYFNSYENKSK